jgi:hypothetical protein
MEMGFCAEAFSLNGLDGQPCHTQIHHARDISIPIAFPVDPHIISRIDPCVESSGPGRYLLGHTFTRIKPGLDILRLGSVKIPQRGRRNK